MAGRDNKQNKKSGKKMIEEQKKKERRIIGASYLVTQSDVEQEVKAGITNREI